MKRETVAEIWVFVLLVAVGVGMRLMSNSLELWNFAPVTAAALFAGYFLSRRSVAVAVPVLIMVVSNFWLLSYDDWRVAVAIYAAVALPVLCRGILRKRYSVVAIGGCAAGSSLAFFMVSNIVFWYFYGALQTPAMGLWQSYVAAVPFYKYTLASDLVWSALFFGSYTMAARIGVVSAVHAEVKVPTGAGITPAAR